jgi:hypothetical protein
MSRLGATEAVVPLLTESQPEVVLTVSVPLLIAYTFYPISLLSVIICRSVKSKKCVHHFRGPMGYCLLFLWGPPLTFHWMVQLSYRTVWLSNVRWCSWWNLTWPQPCSTFKTRGCVSCLLHLRLPYLPKRGLTKQPYRLRSEILILYFVLIHRSAMTSRRTSSWVLTPMFLFIFFASSWVFSSIYSFSSVRGK